MLECCDILNCIDELLYEIIDSNNNILYPKTEELINEFETIVASYNDDDLIFYSEKNKWYKYHIKTITKENKNYLLKYLLDVSEIKELEEKYQIDSLTSVLTRTTILEKLYEELNECKENNTTFSIVMADIDYFKNINDTYGHVAGDKVLKKLGNIFIKNTLEESNLVGRYGGEEFLFFLKDNDLNETINKINSINKALNNLSIEYNDNTITNITMSFGIYHCNNLNKKITKNTIFEIINNADMALYESKNNGRNQTHIYNEDGTINKI